MEFKIDFKEVHGLVNDLRAAANEIKFGCSRTLNDAAFAAKDEISGVVWPRHVTQRATNFPRATLHVNKASKENLTVELNETKSDILKLHDEGGTVSAHGSRALVVPVTQYRRGKMTSTHGLRADARLGRLLARASAKRTVRIVRDKVYVAARGAGLKLAFVIKSAVQQKADVPLTKSWNDVVTRVVDNQLLDNIDRAFRTSRYFK
jgi:hypothetical protein